MRALVLAACLAIAPLAAARADAVEIVADAAKASGDVTNVVINNMSYSPAAVTVKRGAIVRWKNEEETAHNVQLRGGPAKGWDKAQGPLIAQGEFYALKFNEPGSYKYICTPHSIAMKGEVTVE